MGVNRVPVGLCLAGLWAAIALAASPLGARQAAPGGQQAAQEHAAAQAGAPGERPFKNIQVLKDFSHTQVLEGMQYITVALGQRCEFCHNTKDFSNDDKKEKQTARKMMTMLLAIDKDNFNGRTEVSCYTCHQGRNQPVAAPMPPGGEAPEPVSAATMPEPKQIEPPAGAPIPTVAAILARYKDAMGAGAAAASLMLDVERSGGGNQQAIAEQIYQKAPNKVLTVLHLRQATLSAGFDGTKAWAASPRGSGDISGMQAIQVTRAGPVNPAELDAYTGKRLAAMVQLGDKKAYLVMGKAPDGNLEELYFDADSGLLLRQAIVYRTIFGSLLYAIDYSDYRSQDGLKIAFRRDWWAGGHGWSETVKSVQANAPVTDAQFEPPPSPAQPAPASPGSGR
ncbi:MAG TPA: c-type cytochrome [Candidatus Acidoferrales bacterium]|nr:c-type cytochrome [Candidatus Acidoferrales bacterium]